MPLPRWRSWASTRLRGMADALDGRPLPRAGPAPAPATPFPRVLSVGSPGVLDLDHAPPEWAARVRAAAAALNLPTDTDEGLLFAPQPLVNSGLTTPGPQWSAETGTPLRIQVLRTVGGLARRRRGNARGAAPRVEAPGNGRAAEPQRLPPPTGDAHHPTPVPPDRRGVVPPRLVPPGRAPRLVLRARPPLPREGSVAQRAWDGRGQWGPGVAAWVSATPRSSVHPSTAPAGVADAPAGGTDPEQHKPSVAPRLPDSSPHSSHGGTRAAHPPVAPPVLARVHGPLRLDALAPQSNTTYAAAPARLPTLVLAAPSPPLRPATPPAPVLTEPINVADLWPVLPAKVERPAPAALPVERALAVLVRLAHEQAAV